MMWGGEALEIGWIGILQGVMTWYANPLWIVGALFTILRVRTVAAIAGILACAVACTIFSLIGRDLVADESGSNYMRVVRLLPGAWAWMASLVVLPLANVFRRRAA